MPAQQCIAAKYCRRTADITCDGRYTLQVSGLQGNAAIRTTGLPMLLLAAWAHAMSCYHYHEAPVDYVLLRHA